jgi:hypothetical protein
MQLNPFQTGPYVSIVTNLSGKTWRVFRVPDFRFYFGVVLSKRIVYFAWLRKGLII